MWILSTPCISRFLSYCPFVETLLMLIHFLLNVSIYKLLEELILSGKHEFKLSQGHWRGVWKWRSRKQRVWKWPQAYEMPPVSASLQGQGCIPLAAWSAGLRWQPSNLICQKDRLLAAAPTLRPAAQSNLYESHFSTEGKPTGSSCKGGKSRFLW